LQLINSDCLQALKDIPDNSIDSLVTDPPYGWKFMGKKWDYDIPSIEVWQECLRVLKPGAHALVCCGTRTQHRMAVNLEDAGFEIRDLIAWVYGSGFPKSYNIGKNLDKFIKTGNASWNGTGDSSNGCLGYAKLQHEQGYRPNDYSNAHQNNNEITEPLAKQWNGWGTALKPSMELWTLCRKPLIGTVANNVLKYGTGGINIDGCRVETKDNLSGGTYGGTFSGSRNQDGTLCKAIGSGDKGRFPANLIHDGSDEVVDIFPNGSSRFFYCAKASKSERNMGCEGLEEVMKKGNGSHNGRVDTDPVSARFQTMTKNHHPTVKPVSLMRYLCKLITPPHGMVLDPYMGSGSTGIACKLEGFDFTGIEIDPEYIKIAEARIFSVLPLLTLSCLI